MSTGTSFSFSAIATITPGTERAPCLESHSRPDGGARSGRRAADVRTGLQGRPRHHVQLVRGTRADSGCELERRRSRRRRRRGIGGAGAAGAAALPPEAQHRRAVRDLRGPHRREQGLRRALLAFPTVCAYVSRRAVARAHRQRPACRCRHIRGSGIWASFPTRTSSTPWRQPTCWSCRRTTRACRWWRWKRGRSGKPVLANGKCDVLRGQCIRSSAGLYYESYAEFSEAHLRARGQRAAQLGPRSERPRVLPAALFLAGHRTEVSRDVRAADTRKQDGRRQTDSSLCQDGWRGDARTSGPPGRSSPRCRQGLPPWRRASSRPGGRRTTPNRRASHARTNHERTKSEARTRHGSRTRRGARHEGRGARPQGRRWHRSTRSSRR